MFFLTTLPLWASGAIVFGSAIIIALLGPFLVRRFVPLQVLSEDNEVAGFQFAAIGVLYAVLLAFAIILVWQRFSDAEITVAREAGAVDTIYRLSNGINEKARAAVRAELANYLAIAIKEDWPAMDRGAIGGSQAARQALDKLYQAALAFEPTQRVEVVSITEILHQLDTVTRERRSRLVAAEGVVPGVVWLVLFLGGLVAIGFTFFFGSGNLRAQMSMTAMLAILIAGELLAIVTIDRPFSGPVHVAPHALEQVLREIKSASAKTPGPSEQH